MKKNAIFLFGLSVFFLLTGNIHAHVPNTVFEIQKANDVPHGYDGIVLEGNLLFGVGPNAIVAGYNENFVFIQFNQNFGYIDVTLYNTNGQAVYNDVVNTAVQQQVVIPISRFDNGVYTVVLENVTGYADGDFEVED